MLINIQTGEILAMASFPLQPQQPEGATLDDFRNRAISDTFDLARPLSLWC
ncbi:hypothetical protein ACVXG7_20750 [Enterobacter hormaechei]